MSRAGLDVPPKGGFSFDLCRRNEMLVEKGLKPPSFLKTGTTIVGLVFEWPDGKSPSQMDAVVAARRLGLGKLGPGWPDPRLGCPHQFSPDSRKLVLKF
ncbi:hypothetical protein Taro_043847 [Colocasia esculenta]|uniref:Uncharacterized protein n=1 Tax=Colocasia esculenta TaxID=4460 RepID=A0A843WWS6_COLES|nr:hypothetical protein [Colocasia esculenta]